MTIKTDYRNRLKTAAPYQATNADTARRRFSLLLDKWQHLWYKRARSVEKEAASAVADHGFLFPLRSPRSLRFAES